MNKIVCLSHPSNILLIHLHNTNHSNKALLLNSSANVPLPMKPNLLFLQIERGMTTKQKLDKPESVLTSIIFKRQLLPIYASREQTLLRAPVSTKLATVCPSSNVWNSTSPHRLRFTKRTTVYNPNVEPRPLHHDQTAHAFQENPGVPTAQGQITSTCFAYAFAVHQLTTTMRRQKIYSDG